MVIMIKNNKKYNPIYLLSYRMTYNFSNSSNDDLNKDSNLGLGPKNKNEIIKIQIQVFLKIPG